MHHPGCNAAAARLLTTATTGQNVTVQIAPGKTGSPSSVASGGVALDALSDGTTEVSARITGYMPTTAAAQTVIISP